MTTLLQVQSVLDRIFNKNRLPLHYEFWKTDDHFELVNTKLFELPLFEPGNSDESNLIIALKNKKNNLKIDNAKYKPLESYFDANYSITDNDIKLLENWVGGFDSTLKHEQFLGAIAMDEDPPGDLPLIDEKHIEYWRNIDIFFLPGLASPETLRHVLNLHTEALSNWLPSNLTGGDPNQWSNFLSKPDILESFRYIRLHQRRLIQEYYGNNQELLFDSLWKFGGDLLPVDPLSKALPKHTMNGVFDWMCWIPYLDATLRAGDADETDYALARGWQIGIVADGLLRTDSDRPVGSRMPITDFDATNPNLRENVFGEFNDYDAQKLLAKMISRANDALEAGGIFPF